MQESVGEVIHGEHVIEARHFTQKGKEKVGPHEQEETTQLMENDGEVTESGDGLGSQRPSGKNVDDGDEASAGQRVTEVSFEGRAHLGSLDVMGGQQTQPAEGGMEGQGVEEGTKVDSVGETDQESDGRGGQGVEHAKVAGV